MDLIEMLSPRGVVLPSQILSSPHVSLQRQRRQEKEKERGRGKGRKRRNQQRNFYHQLSGLDLLDAPLEQLALFFFIEILYST